MLAGLVRTIFISNQFAVIAVNGGGELQKHIQ